MKKAYYLTDEESAMLWIALLDYDVPPTDLGEEDGDAEEARKRLISAFEMADGLPE